MVTFRAPGAGPETPPLAIAPLEPGHEPVLVIEFATEPKPTVDDQWGCQAEAPPPTAPADVLLDREGYDVTAAAVDVGFAAPVRLDWQLHLDTIAVWSPCACEGCESKARSVTRDRIVRLLKTLRAAVAGAPLGVTDFPFTLDMGVRGVKERKVVALRARMGPNGLVICAESGVKGS